MIPYLITIIIIWQASEWRWARELATMVSHRKIFQNFKAKLVNIITSLSMGFIAHIYPNGTAFMNTDFSIKLSLTNTVGILDWMLQGFVIPVERPRPACAGCSRSSRTTPEAGGAAVLTVTLDLARLAVRPGGGTAFPPDCRGTGWSSPPSPTATRRLSASTPR